MSGRRILIPLLLIIQVCASAQTYVGLGEQYLGKPWAPLSMKSFARYKGDGNRVEYEGQVFARRRQLAELVMAEVSEGKGRFIENIRVGVDSMLAEPWWGIPAHYGYDAPRYDVQTVDLFNAESASLIAWTGKVLGPQLDSAQSGTAARISKEIHHRILEPVLGAEYWWKTARMNWNPWICSNWLTCVYLYETDAGKRQAAVTEIEGCLRAFIDGYPSDGGCDEGPGYWDRSAASLYECIDLLRKMRKEGLAKVTLPEYEQEKVARMGAYIYNMYIGSGYVVTYADVHENRNMVQLDVLYPFAVYLNDPIMRSFAACIAQTEGFWDNPGALYDKIGNFPTLGRELKLLSLRDSLRMETPLEPQNSAWLPDLQVRTLRTEGLFAAFKGGNNDESHNHNDIGNIVVFADGQPLLVDVGVGEYTSQTFSDDRYSIWTMQSAYHNVPLVNGFQQKDGAEYKASVVSEDDDGMTLELAAAYPKEAGIESWTRSVNVSGKRIVLKDSYSLKEYKGETQLNFLTLDKPDISAHGRIVIGGHTISYPKGRLSATIEDISDRLDPILSKMWGNSLYRVTLHVSGNRTADSLTLTIK